MAYMNQEFITYCKENPEIPLPSLINNFKSSHPQFNVDNFISWKSQLNNDTLTEFYNFPFLRDQLFISYFRTLELDLLTDFEAQILEAQVIYYKKFINPNFHFSTPQTKASKCPFAQKVSATIPKFAIESLSKLRYSVIDSTHISDMQLSGLTAHITRPGMEMCEKTTFHVLTSGTHFGINFNDPAKQFILFSDALIKNPLNVVSEVVNELFKVKQVITASDALFLFPSNVLVINPNDLDLFLNFVVYLNILKRHPLNTKTLRSIAGLKCKNLVPSQLEAYSDILTVEYIQNNPDLFK